MKILQINAVGQASSTGRTCKEFHEYINNKTDYTCYTAFAQGEIKDNCYQIGNKLERKLHGLLSRFTGKQAHFSYRGTMSLIKYMDSIKPDVVVLRNVHSNYLNLPAVMRYLAEKDIATVAVLHDCWFYTGKCTHYTVDGCFRWKSGCGNCPRLKKDNKSWFIDASSSLWREKKELFESIPRLSVVGVSDWITNEAKESYLSCALELRRIYNWIDLDVFKPMNNAEELRRRYQLENKKVIIGVSSKWGDGKGLNQFIELAGKLSDDYKIALVGGISEDVILPNNICNIPATSSTKELAELYSMADVFVTMSLEESFGKVSAEALSCGTPVVCFDSTANKELVGDGCGKVIQSGNIDEMAEALKEVCSRKKAEYVSICRAYAEKNFRKEDNIKEYLELFDLLESKKIKK